MSIIGDHGQTPLPMDSWTATAKYHPLHLKLNGFPEKFYDFSSSDPEITYQIIICISIGQKNWYSQKKKKMLKKIIFS